MQYADFETYIAELTGIPSNDTDLVAILPAAITYAENRIYRDLDFLQTRTSGTATSTANNPVVALPNTIIVLESVTTSTGTPLIAQSLDYMQLMYPNTGTGAAVTPTDFAMIDNGDIWIGPVPSSQVTLTVRGTQRPAQLSATNTSTWLATNLPDLYVAAAMVFLSGYMKNYAGATSDDPQQPINWEQQYQTLKAGALVEEWRRKLQGQDWSNRLPSPIAKPAMPQQQ